MRRPTRPELGEAGLSVWRGTDEAETASDLISARLALKVIFIYNHRFIQRSITMSRYPTSGRGLDPARGADTDSFVPDSASYPSGPGGSGDRYASSGDPAATTMDDGSGSMSSSDGGRDKAFTKPFEMRVAQDAIRRHIEHGQSDLL